MTNSIPHPGMQSLFALLSLADLSLTLFLLNQTEGQFYEFNPLARAFLDRHGWPGLVCFKGALVLLVLFLVTAIARSRPATSCTILGLGCALLGSVVLYSATLWQREVLGKPEHSEQAVRELNEELKEYNRQARDNSRKAEAFFAQLSDVCDEVASGHRTLRQAAEWVAVSYKGRDASFQRGLGINYPGRPLPEQFAAWVMVHVVARMMSAPRSDPSMVWAVVLRLEREFRLTYGTTPPENFRVNLPPIPVEPVDTGSRRIQILSGLAYKLH